MTVKLPAAPQWLLNKLAPVEPPAPAQQLSLDSAPEAPNAPPDVRLRGWARSGFTAEVNRLETTQEDARGSTLNAVAYRLYRFESAGLLTEQEIDKALLSACRSNGLMAKDGEKRVLKIIAEGKKAGRNAGRPTLPDFSEHKGEASNGNGKLTAPPLPAESDIELEQLRRFVKDVERVLTSEWKPATKITRIYLDLRKLDGNQQLLDIPGQEIARNVNLSPSTVNNCIRQMSLADLVERRVDTVLMDRQRQEVDPRQVDPRSDAYHWESNSTIFAPSLPEELPARLPDTPYDTKQKLKAAAARLRQTACPCCGETGLSVVCTSCGATVDAEDDS